MSQPTAPRPRLVLTRRGRLVRTGLVLVLLAALLLLATSLLRALGGDAESSAPAEATTPTAPSSAPSDGGGEGSGASDGGGEAPASSDEAGDSDAPATPEAEIPSSSDTEAMTRTGTVGDGTWTVAQPVTAEPAESAADTTVRTYALRVEDGIDIDAEEAAVEVADILADSRGWQDLENVVFQQVGSPDEAEFTISLASPPTADELCLPARTDGLWNCRVGADVVLNSDRWLHASPTYEDLAEYRAYMINHEVGHFLGHQHASCDGEGEPAPVMLQQSMGLDGCVPHAWPVPPED